MSLNIKQNSGLTLIELMVAVGILGITAMGFSSLVNQVFTAQKSQTDL